MSFCAANPNREQQYRFNCSHTVQGRSARRGGI